MKPRYLIRLDDVCPTMNWTVWDRLEAALAENDVRPLVAVIPDNQDDRLRFSTARSDFWDRVRSWQARGWAIGLHGYQHRPLTSNRGRKSEFAGLPRVEQAERLHRALEIFAGEGIEADAWVAPWHASDDATVALVREAGIPVISDGLALYPFADGEGIVRIPQQLWWLRWRPLGVWTVCLHPNRWTPGRLERFGRDLSRYADRITDVPTLLELHGDRRRSLGDRWFGAKRSVRKRLRDLARAGAAMGVRR